MLRPTGTTQFIPDPRVWAILYSWRVPGFDIDGDGFIGVPNQSAASGISQAVAEASGDVIERNDVDCGENGLRNIAIEQITASPGVSVSLVCENAGVPLDDYINIGLNVAEQDPPELDGIIEFQCGAAATGMVLTLLGFAGMRISRRRNKR